MFYTQDPADTTQLLPPPPPPPVLQPAPPPPAPSPPPAPARPADSTSSAGEPRNANGETLAEAEAAVLALVAQGVLGADALAAHPLPPGTSTAEALRFLASLPQTTYQSGQPGGTVTGPPVGGSGAVPPTGGGDDFADSQAIAEANDPNLSDLPAWELLDPEGERTLAAANPPLKGNSALSAIVQACADYDVDPHAAVANALRSGADGLIGDSGLGYGPFLTHVTELAGSPQHGKGAHNQRVQAWAWTPNGIEYAVRRMVTDRPSARGLHGHPACYAIVKGKGRDVNVRDAYRANIAEYDKLGRLGPGWAAYAAPLLKGPAAGGAVDSVPSGPPAAGAYHPAGVVAQWRGLIDVFKITGPKKQAAVQSVFDNPKELFR